LKKERERLVKLDCLTLIEYIKTSIQILMEMKAENENDMSKEGGIRSHRFGIRDGENGAASEFTSTFQSLDLPPKEYEQQLQQYESEVRNHIKVE
jgi:hypothetical protein